MRVEPLQAIAYAVVGAVIGLAVAAWWWLGCPGQRAACR